MNEPVYDRRKRYVRFAWWQYKRGMAVLLTVALTVGFTFGYVAGRAYGAFDRANLQRQVDVLTETVIDLRPGHRMI